MTLYHDIALIAYIIIHIPMMGTSQYPALHKCCHNSAKLTSNVSNIITTAAIPHTKNRLLSRCLVHCILYFFCYLTTEGLMSVVYVACKEWHGYYFKYEVCYGNVCETENEKHTCTEVKGKHSVVSHDCFWVFVELFTYLFWHIRLATIFFSYSFHEFLELWCLLLLFLCIGDIRF